MIPTDDAELFDWIAANLYAAVLSDSCDQLGRTEQTMGPEIRPTDESLVLVGRARTSLWHEMYHAVEHPYEGEIQAMDSLRPGDVAVLATNRSQRIATLGELMGTACLKRGGRGAVTDGLIRDVRGIRKLRIPVFAAGYRPVDSRGRGGVVAHDVPVEISGVRIEPGDMVVGDIDGVVVIPRAIERDVLELAWQKVTAENRTRQELEEGRLLGEVYAKYGVL